MGRIILTYGLIASLFLVISSAAVWGIMGQDNFPFASIGWLSYVFMGISFGILYMGLSRIRQLNGKLHLQDGIKFGMLMVLMMAISYGIYMYFFMGTMGEPFLDYYVEVQKKSLKGRELKQFSEMLEERRALYLSPMRHAGMAFVTVTAFGFIVCLISSMRLKK